MTRQIDPNKVLIRPSHNHRELASVLERVLDWHEQDKEAQWKRKDVALSTLETSYELDELFIALVDSEPQGCMVLQTYDKVYWPEKTEQDSLYLHKLAVIESALGSGLADHMLQWANPNISPRDYF